jgi:hypothetical protein
MLWFFHLPMTKLKLYTRYMEAKKVSKKALKTLLSDSLRDAIGRLELPAPNKKIEKLIVKSSKKFADEYAGILKKSRKKKKTSESDLTFVEDVLNGKGSSDNKNKKTKKSKLKPV